MVEMADEEGKATPAPESVEPAPAAEKDVEPAQEPESEQTSGQPADPSAEEEVKTADAPEEIAADGAVEPQQPETQEVDGEQEATATDAPPAAGSDEVAPAQEATGEVEPSSQEVADDAEQSEEQKPGTDEKPETEEAQLEGGEEEQKPQENVTETTDEAPLPKSEDFTTGEQPEAGINVTAEELSREGTPTAPPDGGIEEGEVMRPDTPENDEDADEVISEEEEEEVPKVSREELVEKYHAALQEREMLNQKNHALQHKLAEYFKRKKTEDSRQEVDRNVTDQEQRYMKYMTNLEELRQQEAGERESYNEQIEEIKDRRAMKQTLVEEEWKVYCDFKRSVALASVNSRSGRPLTLKEFEVYEINEVKKEAEVSQVRLENIKLKNRLRKRELQLKQKEELAEGLHLIDFEQLKIENQTYNEKIEERNEELMKLRKKIRSTVQVLTHLKEKLQFVQGENHVAKQELAHVEGEVAGKRDILSRTKQARDALRHDNSKLQQKCGLLGNRLLLRDYEDGVDEIGDLSHRLDQLKRTHAELTLSISGVKKKIEQAKAQQQIG